MSGTSIIQNNYSELVGDLIVKPGPELLDPATDGLKQDLTVAVTSTTTPIKRTWSKGMLPGVFPVPLTLARDVERWPFDSYYTGPVTVSLFTGTEAPERANVTIVDRLTGWNVHVNRVNDANPTSPYVVTLQRSASTMLFAFVILLIFVAIAVVALFVAIQTYRDPSEVSVAADNLVCGDAVCGRTAEKRPPRLAGVRKLDRSHDCFVGTGGFGDLDAALHRWAWI
jgi:hypothetical protein